MNSMNGEGANLNSNTGQPDEYTGSGQSPGATAIAYLRKGYSVIPLCGKKPLDSWKAYQTRRPTEEEIRTWFTQNPDAGVGLICGKISGNLAVFDVDTDLPNLAQRVIRDIDSVPTLVIGTPSGGVHIYLRETNNPSGNCQFSTNVAGQDIHVADVKAEGGYVVAPPTDGYSLLNSKSILAVENAQIWALDFLKKYGVEVSNPGSKRAYDVLRGKDVHEGERDSVLTSYAGKFWKDGWTQERILMALKSINKEFFKPPLVDEQVEKIVNSVSRYPRNSTTAEVEFSPVSLGELPEPPPREDLVAGLLPEDHTTVLYGDGGHGKSYVGLALAMHVALGRPFLKRAVKQTNVLYLDWELDQKETTRRAYEVARGMQLERPPVNLCYGSMEQRISTPLMETVRRHIQQRQIGLVVIDSVGYACKGDVERAEAVLEFFLELKRLRTQVLAIDHQPKLYEGERYSRKTPFGSVYKTNSSRSVLQIQCVGKGEEHIDLKLHHTKHNFGALSGDLGIRLNFEKGEQGKAVRIEPFEPASRPAANRKVRRSDGVLANLRKEGAGTETEVSKRTGIPEGSVGNAFRKLGRRDLARKVGKRGRKDVWEAVDEAAPGQPFSPATQGG